MKSFRTKKGMSAKDRTFGVEIECGHDSLYYGNIATRLRTAGFKVANGYADNPGYKKYSVSSDGSGIEVRTPILSGDEGYEELDHVMNHLNKLGCWVSMRDGMHVHIGAKFLQDDEDAVECLARTWERNQHLIGRMCSSHRTGRGSCPRLNADEIADLGKPRKEHHGVYYGDNTGKWWGARKSLNLQNIPHKGTVEFRLHEGCLDPKKAIAWVQFCQHLVDYAESERKVFTCQTKRSFLKTLGVPQETVDVLAKRQKQMPLHGQVRAA